MDHYGSLGAIRVLLNNGTPTPIWGDISSSREQARTSPYKIHIVPSCCDVNHPATPSPFNDFIDQTIGNCMFAHLLS